MIGYPFTFTNRNGLSINFNDHDSDPNNFVALQEYPAFDVDIKNIEIDKDGQHGIWDFNSFYGKRVMTFAGVIIGSSEANIETLKTRLLQVTSLPARPTVDNDGLVLIQWTDANNEGWQVYAKLDRAIRFNRNLKEKSRLDFVMTLKAPDPSIRSQLEQLASGFRTWEQSGFTVPFFVPFTIGLSYHDHIIVTNNGSFEADTIIRLTGEADTAVSNPYIYNLTTGEIFKVNITLLDETKWIEIDSQAGTVVNEVGVDVSAFVDPVSNYIKLAVGENDLIYWSDESNGLDNPLLTGEIPEAVATIRFRDTTI